MAVGVVHLHGERRRDCGADVGRLLIARGFLQLGDRLGDRDRRRRIHGAGGGSDVRSAAAGGGDQARPRHGGDRGLSLDQLIEGDEMVAPSWSVTVAVKLLGVAHRLEGEVGRAHEDRARYLGVRGPAPAAGGHEDGCEEDGGTETAAARARRHARIPG